MSACVCHGNEVEFLMRLVDLGSQLNIKMIKAEDKLRLQQQLPVDLKNVKSLSYYLCITKKFPLWPVK